MAANTFAEPLHPKGYDFYVADFGVANPRRKVAALDDGEIISSITSVSFSSAAQALGLSVDQVTNPPSLVSDGDGNASRAVKFWVSVAVENQGDDWVGDLHKVEFVLVTSQGRTLVETASIRVCS